MNLWARLWQVGVSFAFRFGRPKDKACARCGRPRADHATMYHLFAEK